MPSKVQLFPRVHAIEVLSAVPETTELDSLLGRVVCTDGPSRPGRALPQLQVGRIQAKSAGQRLVAAGPSTQCPWDAPPDTPPSCSAAGQGTSALPLGFASPLLSTS